jgi:lysophospholipase L1-like esterase
MARTSGTMVGLPLRIRPAIVLFGDSITHQGFGWEGGIGWASLLSSDYSRRADVLNRGFSGYNTRHAVELLPRIFATAPPTDGVLFTTVFFGANDAALPGELQHVPIDEYGKNLEKIVAYIRTSQKPQDEEKICTDDSSNIPIILMTPPPVDVGAWKSNDRANEVAREYGNRVKEVAANTNCAVLDVFELLGGNSDDPEKYGHHLRDGLHLSESGNKLVYQGLKNLIATDFIHLAPMLDGQGKYGKIGIPLEEDLWSELV